MSMVARNSTSAQAAQIRANTRTKKLLVKGALIVMNNRNITTRLSGRIPIDRFQSLANQQFIGPAEMFTPEKPFISAER